MSDENIALSAAGLVTSVGQTMPSACAAIRAKLANPGETRYIGAHGSWLVGHMVALDRPFGALTKLVKMAAMAIEEALDAVPRSEWGRVPLLMCVAESDRPGRLDGLDTRLVAELQRELGTPFGAGSALVAHGRVGIAHALARARRLLYDHRLPYVLIAATDSYLCWPTLRHYEAADRLLGRRNSNGFLPGEGAGALLVSRPKAGDLMCTGIGFGIEPAPIGSDEPLRADGLTTAINSALRDARRVMQDMDFRIADLSGEHYYFKEATLALSRTLHVRKERFAIWHPAECTGEVGAVAGVTMLALANWAGRKGYSEGRTALLHMGTDAGERAALTVSLGEIR
jgi:3-oxoacyl-[acyl-carrier-protein] synthase-1